MSQDKYIYMGISSGAAFCPSTISLQGSQSVWLRPFFFTALDFLTAVGTS